MNKVLLCANADRVEKTELVIEKILGKGLEARVYFPFRSSENFKYPELISRDPEADAGDSDMLICMGGDGTILSCSKLAAKAGIPVLGINYGHKGFIAALEPDEMELLDGILNGSFETEDRMMISARVIRNGETVFSDFGLNETVIKSAASHPVRVTVFGDGVEITAFSGDGIIIATPTGSTAYSMSAGGPIVEPNAENLILTPICAHALNAKTVVLKGSRKVNVELGSSVDAVLSVDGNCPFAVYPGDEIEITKSKQTTRLVVGTNRSFYEIVKRKLNTDI
ncbi:MAG: NAD(+)/NADH kinase [Clostridiales bacterium]|nr:NAD(+)/NADH kinase [Clostridiales bacterium]